MIHVHNVSRTLSIHRTATPSNRHVLVSLVTSISARTKSKWPNLCDQGYQIPVVRVGLFMTFIMYVSFSPILTYTLTASYLISRLYLHNYE
ncbi:hypothetical protein BDN70DRAFT_172074 [Pholiota conissans]|uniref:Uncharacterized protein n=1 Tax=Pholiota conissans TaxID=109636 RepID=A0A9P5YYP4_9AGAR|nr:hypothetical protein BDN70DRAFT_172074 [Pholiota conissans]